MQHADRPRRTHRLALLLVPLAGATVFAAGPAAAATISYGGNPPGNSDSSRSPGAGGNRPGIVNHGNDHSGIHASDPLGFHHTDTNPVLQNQHPRPPGATRPPSEQPTRAGANNPATWTPTWNADGSGYTVCPAHASHC
ncbi:hypothetical protein [Nocardia tengchongensis]|uniref:hypothetical protein n=1 Tax=Nocardia tengchongensis TaxID=2055889 RepID=UPI00361CC55F